MLGNIEMEKMWFFVLKLLIVCIGTEGRHLTQSRGQGGGSEFSLKTSLK